jgi:hypothetical protein
MNQAEIEATAAMTENDEIRDALLGTKKVFGIGGLNWTRGAFSALRHKVFRGKRKRVEAVCAVGGMRQFVYGDPEEYATGETQKDKLYLLMLRRFVEEGLGVKEVYTSSKVYPYNYVDIPTSECTAEYTLENIIIHWNDNKSRKWDQVRDAFTKAIKAGA